MKTISLLKRAAILFMAVFTIVSCGKDNPVEPEDEASIDLNKNELTLTVTKNERLIPTVYPTNATVKWTSSDDAVATVDNNGVVTAMSVGTATITAEVEGKKAYCAVTVIAMNAITYVVGYERPGGVGTPQVAKLWIDGELLNLTDGTKNSSAESIYVTDDYAYIAGNEGNFARLWKIDRKTKAVVESKNLTDGTNAAFAKSVYVSGGNVYVGGYETVSSVSAPKIWKNGVLDTELSSSGSCTCTSIFVSGNDVHAVGVDGSGLTAVYWKNGNKEELFKGTNGGGDPAKSISVVVNRVYVSGNDVYVTGYYNPYQKHPIAVYCKNKEEFSPYTLNGGRIFGICVSGNNLYYCGDYNVSEQASYMLFLSAATVWRNDQKLYSFQEDGTSRSAYGRDIFVLGGDIYMAGYQAVPPASGTTNVNAASIWKNGSLFETLSGNTYNAYGNAIFVVEKE